MKSALFLRIASVLTMIHCILHTIGGVLSSPKHGSEELAVVETMKAHTFNVMGSMRSYWNQIGRASCRERVSECV